MDAPARINWIAQKLVDAYGPQSIPRQDPVETLVLTILSQNTTDTNRDRAFCSLIETFGDLDKVAEASMDDIASAIRHGGLQQQKAKSIREALAFVVSERGRLDLSFLEELPVDAAMQWLLALQGVGPKTASIVLLFCFDRPTFPVDTHIRRVMRRMGLLNGHGDPHPRLNALLPADPVLMQQLHLLTIRLGREVCHPRNPCCQRCPLRPQCSWTHGVHTADRVTSAHKREDSMQ